MSETPRTNEHAEWLRRRAASPYYALARSGLLDSANAIERLEFNFAALRAENERLKKGAARWEWFRTERHVTLVTMMFGNGCINKTVEMAETEIDAALAAKEPT